MALKTLHPEKIAHGEQVKLLSMWDIQQVVGIVKRQWGWGDVEVLGALSANLSLS